MGELVLRGVTGPVGARPPRVAGVTASVPAGGVLAVIGPSGAGKSTLLRLIAGLEELAAGAVWLGQDRLDERATRERDVALVTQDSLLYRHRDVGGNVALPLELAGVSADERGRRVSAESRVQRLGRLLRRRVGTLSEGERQRTALARGMVRTPSLLLLDEPLARVDTLERERLRRDLLAYLRGVAAPTVLATNDQREAMSLADELLVLDGGVVQQRGAPQEVYDRPATAAVAAFLGSPGAALVPGRVAVGHHTAHVLVGSGAWGVEPVDGAVRRLDGVSVTAAVRPEHLRLAEPGQAGVAGRVHHLEQLGDHVLVHVRLEGVDATVVVRHPVRPGPADPGEPTVVAAQPGGVRLYHPSSGAALAHRR